MYETRGVRQTFLSPPTRLQGPNTNIQEDTILSITLINFKTNFSIISFFPLLVSIMLFNVIPSHNIPLKKTYPNFLFLFLLFFFLLKISMSS